MDSTRGYKFHNQDVGTSRLFTSCNLLIDFRVLCWVLVVVTFGFAFWYRAHFQKNSGHHRFRCCRAVLVLPLQAP